MSSVCLYLVTMCFCLVLGHSIPQDKFHMFPYQLSFNATYHDGQPKLFRFQKNVSEAGRLYYHLLPSAETVDPLETTYHESVRPSHPVDLPRDITKRDNEVIRNLEFSLQRSLIALESQLGELSGSGIRRTFTMPNAQYICAYERINRLKWSIQCRRNLEYGSPSGDSVDYQAITGSEDDFHPLGFMSRLTDKLIEKSVYE